MKKMQIVDQESLAVAAGLQKISEAIRLGKLRLVQPLKLDIATKISERDAKRLFDEIAASAIADAVLVPAVRNGERKLVARVSSSKFCALFESAQG
jgi:hypothetical protein